MLAEMAQAHLNLQTLVHKLNLLDSGARTESLQTLVQELKTCLPKSPLRAQAPGKEQTAKRNCFKEHEDDSIEIFEKKSHLVSLRVGHLQLRQPDLLLIGSCLFSHHPIIAKKRRRLN